MILGYDYDDDYCYQFFFIYFFYTLIIFSILIFIIQNITFICIKKSYHFQPTDTKCSTVLYMYNNNDLAKVSKNYPLSIGKL